MQTIARVVWELFIRAFEDISSSYQTSKLYIVSMYIYISFSGKKKGVSKVSQ